MGSGTYQDFKEKQAATRAQIEPVTEIAPHAFNTPSPYSLQTFTNRIGVAFEDARATRNLTDITADSVSHGILGFEDSKQQERVREIQARREYLGKTNIVNEFVTGAIGEVAGRAYDPTFIAELAIVGVVTGVASSAARNSAAAILSSRTAQKVAGQATGVLAEAATFTAGEFALSHVRNWFKETSDSSLPLEETGIDRLAHDFGTAIAGSLVMRTGAASAAKAWNTARESGMTGMRNFKTKDAFMKAKEQSQFRDYINNRDPVAQTRTGQNYYGEMTQRVKMDTTTVLWDREMFQDTSGNIHNGYEVIFPNIHPAATSITGKLPIRNITLLDRLEMPDYSSVMKAQFAKERGAQFDLEGFNAEVQAAALDASDFKAFFSVNRVDPRVLNSRLLRSIGPLEGMLTDFRVTFDRLTEGKRAELGSLDPSDIKTLRNDLKQISKGFDKAYSTKVRKNAEAHIVELDEAVNARIAQHVEETNRPLTARTNEFNRDDVGLAAIRHMRRARDDVRATLDHEASLRELLQNYIKYMDTEDAATAFAIVDQEASLQLGADSFRGRDLQYVTENWAISMGEDNAASFWGAPEGFSGKGEIIPSYGDLLSKFGFYYSREGLTGWVRTTGDLSNPATEHMHKLTEKTMLKALDDFAIAVPDQEAFYKPMFRTISNASVKRMSMRAITVAPLAEAVHKIGIKRMGEIAKSDAANKRIIGAFFKTSKNVVLNTEEKMLSDAIREVSNNVREMQLTHGFNLGYVEDYLPIQFKDIGSLVKNGVTRDQYIEFWLEGMDWERVDVKESGRVDMIGKSYDSIVNGDEVSIIESKNPFKTEFGRASRSRVFHMKNAEVAYQAMRMFSEATNVVDAVTQHSNSVMNRLGMYRTLGADPYTMADRILQIAKRRMVGKPIRGDKTIIERTLQPRSEFNIEGLQAGFNELTQRYSLYHEGTLFGKVIDGLSKAVITSKLGAIGRFYLEDTTRTVLQSQELNFMIKDMLRETVTPSLGVSKKKATLFGLMLDDCRQIYPSETYYSNIDKGFQTFAELIQVGSGGKFLTNRMKRIAAKNWYRNIASILEGDLTDISPSVKTFLSKHDFGPVDFELLKNTPYNTDVAGVKFYAPRDVFRLKKANERRAVIKLNEAMHDYIRQGVIESDKLSFAMYFGLQQARGNKESANTMQFLAKHISTFTGAPTSLSFLLSVSPNFGQRILQELFWITLTGAGMHMLKEASKGRVPNFSEFDGLDLLKFVLESNKEGGAFGFSSEALLAIIIGGISLFHDENGRELKNATKSLLGSAGADIVVDTVSNTSQLVANLMQGQNGKAIENLLRYFPNFPGLELFLHRVVLEQLDQYSSSSVFGEAMAEYERRQEFTARKTKSLRL